MKKIYLAGFDVFYPDAVQRGQAMKEACAQYGFCGLYPLDNEADDVHEIFEGNKALIRSADLVLANLNPFRGHEMDSGTAFEIGYAHALGKELWGYLDDGRTMREKLGETDANGCSVENFGHPLNLMIAECTHIVQGDFFDCLKQAALCRA